MMRKQGAWMVAAIAVAALAFGLMMRPALNRACAN